MIFIQLETLFHSHLHLQLEKERRLMANMSCILMNIKLTTQDRQMESLKLQVLWEDCSK